MQKVQIKNINFTQYTLTDEKEEYIVSLEFLGEKKPKVGDVLYMFRSCNKLEYLESLDFTNTTDSLGQMFFASWDSPIQDLNIVGTIPTTFTTDLSVLRKLNKKCLLDILNALLYSANGSTLKIGGTNLAKLTDDDISIATNKGWSIV